MKYVEFINETVKKKVLEPEHILLFGQNVAAGSCISGFTRGLRVKPGGRIINTPNCENTLCGIGFGSMMNGVPAIFFMKQQDFLLLGIDHLVNTYNIIRGNIPNASFTIMPIIVDSGYEGPQSSLNNFGDFCSIARIAGFSCTNKTDTGKIIKNHLVSPGFRIIGVSQRLLKQELLELDAFESGRNENYFKYKNGSGATIVCFNYSLPYGFELYNKLKTDDIASSLFSVNTYSKFDFSPIINDLNKTKNLIVIDDSKSGNVLCDSFLFEAVDQCRIKKKVIVKRTFSEKMFYPVSDDLEINYNKIVKLLNS